MGFEFFIDLTPMSSLVAAPLGYLAIVCLFGEILEFLGTFVGKLRPLSPILSSIVEVFLCMFVFLAVLH